MRLIARTLPEDRPVLLPDYLCASVVRPFEQEGRRVAFFGVGDGLAVDPAAVEAQVAEIGPSAVLLIDYFGFAAPLPELPAETVLVLDRSHNPGLGTPVARARTYRVSSLRKTLPVPDGALCDGDGLDQPPAGPARAATLRALGKALRHEFLAGADGALEAAYLELFARGEQELERGAPEAMSAASARRFARTDLDEVAQRRRANFAWLLGAWDDTLGRVATPLYATLPDDVTPLAFPVRVRGDRDALRRELIERRVFCPVHWHLPDNGAHAGDAARRLSAEILSLPVDQRYEPADMAELIERVLAAAAVPA